MPEKFLSTYTNARKSRDDLTDKNISLIFSRSLFLGVH